ADASTDVSVRRGWPLNGRRWRPPIPGLAATNVVAVPAVFTLALALHHSGPPPPPFTGQMAEAGVAEQMLVQALRAEFSLRPATAALPLLQPASDIQDTALVTALGVALERTATDVATASTSVARPPA